MGFAFTQFALIFPALASATFLTDAPDPNGCIIHRGPSVCHWTPAEGAENPGPDGCSADYPDATYPDGNMYRAQTTEDPLFGLCIWGVVACCPKRETGAWCDSQDMCKSGVCASQSYGPEIPGTASCREKGFQGGQAVGRWFHFDR